MKVITVVLFTLFPLLCCCDKQKLSSISPGPTSPQIFPNSEPYDHSSLYAASSVVLEKIYVSSGNETNHKETKETSKLDRGGENKKKTSQSNSIANVLILHPIYAGSHEVVLRELGVELVKRGHRVTQLRWKSDNEAIDIKNNSQKRYSSEHLNDSATGNIDDEDNFMNIITVSVENSDMRYLSKL